jgi:N-methylhydantoinase A
MSYRIGVDIGGTFTDFCAFDDGTGDLRTLKVLSTPGRPGDEVVLGLAELERRFGIKGSEIAWFSHGTTVGINTVIQRHGARLCLFTTESFADVLEVARLKNPDPYDVFSRRPSPLVPRERVFEIRERILADGTIDQPLDEGSVLEALEGVRAVCGKAVVVALLHAYRNPAHEQAIVAILARAAPDLPVICAHAVWPVIREYERTTTAVVAGYVQPRIARYIDRLTANLRAAEVRPEPMITKSNGGIMRAEVGKTECVQMLLSGTASGVIGASHIAQLTGAGQVLSVDIGGTSADVALILNGTPQYGVGERVGDFPVYIPTVAVSSIGAGGGSIARVDAQGLLKVGPESAGSEPGPACYGRGGEQATITDAFTVAGWLGHGELAYDAVRMDRDAARAAVGRLAGRLGRDVEATARAIIDVAVSGMYREVSKLLSRNGIDPRTLTLLAFGGAGPMIAALLARELGMPRIVVPTTPGVLSAFGGLIADAKNDFIQTVYLDLDEAALPELRRRMAALEQQALAWLRDEQQYGGEPMLLYSADMRYRGQSFEIECPLEREWWAEGSDPILAVRRIGDAFHRTHEQTYDHADPKALVQIINLRLVIVGRVPKPALPELATGQGDAVPVVEVMLTLDGAEAPAAVFERPSLEAGQRFQGPAIVLQEDCTTCLPAGFVCTVDRYGNLVIEPSS